MKEYTKTLWWHQSCALCGNAHREGEYFFVCPAPKCNEYLCASCWGPAAVLHQLAKPDELMTEPYYTNYKPIIAQMLAKRHT